MGGICWVLWVEKFFEVRHWGIFMDTLVCEGKNLLLNPGENGKSVE